MLWRQDLSIWASAMDATTKRSIISFVEMADGSGRAIVYDWSAEKQYRLENLEFIGPNGNVVWRAALPDDTGLDCFVGVQQDGDLLMANTMSCFAVWLDPADGRHVRSVFTK
jgi:hypothetical protein